MVHAIRIRSLAATVAAALTLVLAAAPSSDAAFPGVPGTIIYAKSANFGEDGGLVVHGPKQRQRPQQLTSDPGDHDPSYSADGRMIVFAGDRDGNASPGNHIYVARRGGGQVRELTSGGFDSNPSFSPNGRQVVFDRRAAQATRIFIVNVDGGGLRQLTTGSGDENPTFSPSGRQIAFASNRGRRGGIYTVRPSGAGLRELIDSPISDSDPDYSPNGRRIAFTSGTNIFTARANGTHARKLTHSRHSCFDGACYEAPSFAPDGKHIAYLTEGRFNSDIEVMRADGTNVKGFADGGVNPDGDGTLLGAPAWGPKP